MNIDQAFAEVYNAIVRAGELLDMTDIDDDLEQDVLDSLYEERHHCGVCQTRIVMETVWPAIEVWAAMLKAEAQTQSRTAGVL